MTPPTITNIINYLIRECHAVPIEQQVAKMADFYEFINIVSTVIVSMTSMSDNQEFYDNVYGNTWYNMYVLDELPETSDIQELVDRIRLRKAISWYFTAYPHPVKIMIERKVRQLINKAHAAPYEEQCARMADVYEYIMMDGRYLLVSDPDFYTSSYESIKRNKSILDQLPTTSNVQELIGRVRLHKATSWFLTMFAL